MLKKIIISCILSLIAYSSSSQKFIPDLGLKTLNGESIRSVEAINQNGFTIISFWATWCIPCINELDAINEVISVWSEKEDITVLAISTDDSRSKKRVKPLINGKDWVFDVISDTNQDFKRAMGVVGIPHTIVTYKSEIIHRRIGYTPGEEEDLFDVISNHKK
jgi:peroxiredoxin|tara:strand:+ start:464 stop:952 length:489 start_codon:yes stop_codon:yes gene_type:complete